MEPIYDRSVDWKEILIIGSLLGPVIGAPTLFTKSRAGENPTIVTEVWMNTMLANLRRAAVIAANTGILFKKFVSMRSGILARCCEIMYVAFTQKVPDKHCAMAYAWWCSSTPEIAAEITATFANASLQAREAATASFDSYVKKMTSNILAYLDRFYVKRLSLSTLSAVAAPVQAKLRVDLELPALTAPVGVT